VAELLVSFTEPTRSETGDLYWGRAFGRVGTGGLWEGWIEFTRAGDDVIVTSPKETTQPNRADLVYWAKGLTEAYLEGALKRAIEPPPVIPVEPRVFVDSAPKPNLRPIVATPPNRTILDPYQVFAEGEHLLRNQLRALSHDHVQNIAEAYQFVDAADPAWVRTASTDALVERIVERVRARYAATAGVGTGSAAGADQRISRPEDRTA
jgi:hypothetical protein